MTRPEATIAAFCLGAIIGLVIGATLGRTPEPDRRVQLDIPPGHFPALVTVRDAQSGTDIRMRFACRGEVER
jgi:hypothetical protein